MIGWHIYTNACRRAGSLNGEPRVLPIVQAPLLNTTARNHGDLFDLNERGFLYPPFQPTTNAVEAKSRALEGVGTLLTCPGRRQLISVLNIAPGDHILSCRGLRRHLHDKALRDGD